MVAREWGCREGGLSAHFHHYSIATTKLDAEVTIVLGIDVNNALAKQFSPAPFARAMSVALRQ